MKFRRRRSSLLVNYLRQVNELNDGDNCVRSMCVCLCVCARAQQTGQSDQFKTVKAIRTSNLARMFPGTSGRDPLNFFRKGGVGKNSLGGDMHSHERLS